MTKPIDLRADIGEVLLDEATIQAKILELGVARPPSRRASSGS
jgi:hypothetical protein